MLYRYRVLYCRSSKSVPVILVATKLDDPNHEETAEIYELHSLGFGAPWPTGAEHARGVLELTDEIIDRFPKSENTPEEETVRLAIIGRPNVGKSSLLNAFLGEALEPHASYKDDASRACLRATQVSLLRWSLSVTNPTFRGYNGPRSNGPLTHLPIRGLLSARWF